MRTLLYLMSGLLCFTACGEDDGTTSNARCTPECEVGVQCLETPAGDFICARLALRPDAGNAPMDSGVAPMDQGNAMTRDGGMAADAEGLPDAEPIMDAEPMVDAEPIMDAEPVPDAEPEPEPRTRAEEYYDNCMNGPHAAQDPFRADACRMLNYINADRALFDAEAEGAEPVDWNSDLFLVARAHSEDMCNRRFFGHVNPGGQNPGDRVDAAGYDYAVAENIAVNEDVAAAQHAFMAEPTCTGHRGNILTPRSVSVGIGMAVCAEPGFQWDGYLMLTQNFAWDFANGETAYCMDPATDCELPANPVSTATRDCPQRLREWGWCDYDPAEIMAPNWGCPDD